jgi:type I restriction enzyme S subunit
MPMLERPISKAGWTRVAFGDVVRKVNDKVDPWDSGLERYVAGEHMDTDDLRIRRWGLIGDDYLGPAFHMRFKPGHVLYGSRRTYLRKVALADFEGITANTTFVLETKEPARLMPELLPFLMQTEAFHSYSIKYSKGSVNPYINFSDLEAFEFRLPPIQEQARLVDMFSAFWSSIEHYTDCLIAADSLRDALISHTIHFGDGASVMRSTDVGNFPAHWDVLPLGDRYSVQLGKMMSPSAVEGDMQIPYMRNANVQWNRLDLSDVATMSFNEREREKFSLRSGDILACEGRHVGKSAIWRNEIPGACYQKALHRLRPKDPQKDQPEWMLNCLRYYSVAGKLVGRTAETTIPHLPAERLREIVFPFPPRQEQERLGGGVSLLDQQRTQIERRLQGLRESLKEQTSAAIGGMI